MEYYNNIHKAKMGLNLGNHLGMVDLNKVEDLPSEIKDNNITEYAIAENHIYGIVRTPDRAGLQRFKYNIVTKEIVARDIVDMEAEDGFANLELITYSKNDNTVYAVSAKIAPSDLGEGESEMVYIYLTQYDANTMKFKKSTKLFEEATYYPDTRDWELALSDNGNIVSVSLRGHNYYDTTNRYYMYIYDITSGRELSHVLEINAGASMYMLHVKKVSGEYIAFLGYEYNSTTYKVHPFNMTTKYLNNAILEHALEYPYSMELLGVKDNKLYLRYQQPSPEGYLFHEIDMVNLSYIVNTKLRDFVLSNLPAGIENPEYELVFPPITMTVIAGKFMYLANEYVVGKVEVPFTETSEAGYIMETAYTGDSFPPPSIVAIIPVGSTLKIIKDRPSSTPDYGGRA